jgi:hypothetical protein
VRSLLKITAKLLIHIIKLQTRDILETFRWAGFKLAQSIDIFAHEFPHLG